jgi:hypothetical protein
MWHRPIPPLETIVSVSGYPLHSDITCEWGAGFRPMEMSHALRSAEALNGGGMEERTLADLAKKSSQHVWDAHTTAISG